MAERLSIEEFGTYFSSFEMNAFRLETLDVYRVPEEESFYERFLLGDRNLPQTNSEWVSLVRHVVSTGRTISRVHAISLPLSAYVRFEITYAYKFSIDAGEKIGFLDRAVLPHTIASLGDFWIFDSKRVVTMKYDTDGHFESAWLCQCKEDLDVYNKARGVAESLSIPMVADRTPLSGLPF